MLVMITNDDAAMMMPALGNISWALDGYSLPAGRNHGPGLTYHTSMPAPQAGSLVATMGIPMKYATGMVIWMTHSGPITGNFHGAYGFSRADIARSKQIQTPQDSKQSRD